MMMLEWHNMSAQEIWRQYTWDEYKIKFELPERFEVTKNTLEALEAKGKEVTFGLYPLSDKTKFADGQMADFLSDMSKNKYGLSEVEEMEEVELDEMTGGFVIGVKGEKTFAILAAKDPLTTTKFYAVVSFATDNDELFDAALEVFATFERTE